MLIQVNQVIEGFSLLLIQMQMYSVRERVFAHYVCGSLFHGARRCDTEISRGNVDPEMAVISKHLLQIAAPMSCAKFFL
jgi:hypothetical protein